MNNGSPSGYSVGSYQVTDPYRPTRGQGSFALLTVATSAAHCRWFGPRDAEVAGYLRIEDEDTIRFPVQPDVPQPTGAPMGTPGASGRIRTCAPASGDR